MKNIEENQWDFSLNGVQHDKARDMAAMKRGPAMSARILGGWRAAKNGAVWLG